jgi:hypothetical protein
MTVGISSANVATPWLNFFRNTNTTTAFAATYAKLHIGDPGAAGAGNAAVGSTTRVVFTFAAPSGNAIAMTGTSPVWTNGGTSETLSHISVWDAITVGNFGFSAALTASQAWASGNTFTLTSLTLSLTPIAA